MIKWIMRQWAMRAEIERLKVRVSELEDTEHWIPIDELDPDNVDALPTFVEIAECVLWPRPDGTEYPCSAAKRTKERGEAP